MRQWMRLCGVRSECCGLMGMVEWGFEGVDLFPENRTTSKLLDRLSSSATVHQQLPIIVLSLHQLCCHSYRKIERI